MALPEIRLSPSGAPLGELGYVGLQQRFVEANQSCANIAILTTLTPVTNVALSDIKVQLAEPSSEYNYRARARLWVNRLLGTVGELRGHLQVRYTVGGVAGAWTTLRSEVVRDETDLQLGKRQVEYIVGTDTDFGVPAACELMEVRLAMSASGSTTYDIENDGGNGNSGAMMNITLGELVA